MVRQNGIAEGLICWDSSPKNENCYHLLAFTPCLEQHEGKYIFDHIMKESQWGPQQHWLDAIDHQCMNKTFFSQSDRFGTTLDWEMMIFFGWTVQICHFWHIKLNSPSVFSIRFTLWWWTWISFIITEDNNIILLVFMLYYLNFLQRSHFHREDSKVGGPASP